jgi:hypothetical protein
LLFLLVTGCTLSGPPPPPIGSEPLDLRALSGTWQLVGGDKLLVIEPHRLVFLSDGAPEILPVRKVYDDSVIVSPVSDDTPGYQEVFLRRSQNELELTRGVRPMTYRRISPKPRELSFEEIPMGQPGDLASDRIEAIRTELAARVEADQEALKSSDPEAAAAVIGENHTYLLDLVRDVGWIDKQRFGSKTSWHAILILHHGKDLAAMLTARPHVKKDFEGDSENPEVYPVFYDRTELMLGHPQLFGSQIEQDENGEPVVAPLAEPERVDEIRRRQGMSKLEEYLELVSQYLYEGRPVKRFRQD